MGQEDSITDYQMVHYAIGNYWGGETCFGTATFNSHDKAATVNSIFMFGNGATSAGVTGKHFFGDNKTVVKVGGTYRFSSYPGMIMASMTSALKVNCILAGVLPLNFIASQGQVGVEYCPTAGFTMNIGVEINEM